MFLSLFLIYGFMCRSHYKHSLNTHISFPAGAECYNTTHIKLLLMSGLLN